MEKLAYSRLADRLAYARSWANGVTPGNRCALVVGVALGLKPESEAKSFRALTRGLTPGVAGQPFLARFYVKAQDLADDIERVYGPPNVRVPGTDAIALLKDRRGVLFMEGCWGPTIDLGFLVIPRGEKSWDHIDLWDGTTLEIYRDQASPEKIQRWIGLSRAVWFWDARDAAS